MTDAVHNVADVPKTRRDAGKNAPEAIDVVPVGARLHLHCARNLSLQDCAWCAPHCGCTMLDDTWKRRGRGSARYALCGHGTADARGPAARAGPKDDAPSLAVVVAGRERERDYRSDGEEARAAPKVCCGERRDAPPRALLRQTARPLPLPALTRRGELKHAHVLDARRNPIVRSPHVA